MGIPATAVWEVRDTGNDANGGFFDSTSAGTDYSQQDSAQWSGNVTSDGADLITDDGLQGLFTSAMVGNGINVAGTLYQISAFVDSNNVRIAATRGAASGLSTKVGGALATITKLLSSMVTENAGWVKLGSSYAMAADVTANPGAANAGIGNANRLFGYGSTRGDGGRPTILASGSTTKVLYLNNTGWWVENFIIDCDNVASTTGIETTSYSFVYNVQVKNFKSIGIKAAGYAQLLKCEVNGGASGASRALDLGASSRVDDSYIHDNLCPGIGNNISALTVTNSRVINNTGGSSDGISCYYGSEIRNNLIRGNGRDGIRQIDFNMNTIVQNNILYGNGGYGLNFTAGTVLGQVPWVDYNAYRSNTSGAVHGVTAGAHDVTLTGDPNTNFAGGDFTLNNTAGAGAACRAVGTPAYSDIGPYQHQDAGGGAAGARLIGPSALVTPGVAA